MSKGRLTAISQYHCFSVFASLQRGGALERIRDAICAFHERVRGCFDVASYVFDVVVLGGLDDLSGPLSVQLIELNPFGAAMSSGSVLFNWEKDSDLLYGRAPTVKPPIRALKLLIDADQTQRQV